MHLFIAKATRSSELHICPPRQKLLPGSVTRHFGVTDRTGFSCLMARKGKLPAGYDDDDYGDDDYYDDEEYYGDDDYGGSSSHADRPMYAERVQSDAIPQSGQQHGPTMAQSNSKPWTCSVCLFDNAQQLKSCDICGVIRHSPAPPPSDTAKMACNLAAASPLAKSLFIPLPGGKSKTGSILQQAKDRLMARLSSNLSIIAESKSSALSQRHTNVEIVPFKFDTPSPDDSVLVGKQTAIKCSAGKAFPKKDTSMSSTKSTAAKAEAGFPLMAKSARQPTQGQGLKSKDPKKEVTLNMQKNEAFISDRLKATDLSPHRNVEGNVVKRGAHPLDAYEPESWIFEGLEHENKQLLHLAIVGHVDAGKSTLMGRALHVLGKVSQKEMHKYEKEAKQSGKGSFSYAWVLDESLEERARGVTMTVAVATFETTKFRVILLDSPGHKDFVPNMISGASQADAAILVVDASIGAFEAGIEGEGQGAGQTREHTQLIRSFGVEQIIVAVNKMDAVDYSQARFNAIKATLRPFLRHCGFKDSGIKWVPLSAMENQNLVSQPSNAKLKTWCSGPTLLEAIDTFEPSARDVEKPFRMPIAETMKSRTLGQAAVSGKVVGGAIKLGSKVLVMPSGNVATVKVIEQDGKPCCIARAGDNVDIGLQGVEPSSLLQGGVLCHPDYRVPVVSRLELKVLVLEHSGPLLRGSQVIFHCHHLKEPAKITELVALLDQKSGEILKKKPRCLLANQSAVIEVVPDRDVCLEEYSRCKALGRVSLRDRGKTLAVGVVTRVID